MCTKAHPLIHAERSKTGVAIHVFKGGWDAPLWYRAMQRCQSPRKYQKGQQWFRGSRLCCGRPGEAGTMSHFSGFPTNQELLKFWSTNLRVIHASASWRRLSRATDIGQPEGRPAVFFGGDTAILRALETGSMRTQAKGLSPQERMAVSLYLAGFLKPKAVPPAPPAARNESIGGVRPFGKL